MDRNLWEVPKDPPCLNRVKLIPVAFDTAGILGKFLGLANLLSWVELMITDILIGGLPLLYRCRKTGFLVCF